MTTGRSLERDLPSIIGEMVAGPYPDYIEHVLAETAQRRQRPVWTFPGRWLPMDFATEAVRGAPRIPWRTISVLAILAALVAAATLAFVAGSQRPLPAPFGPAANGLVAYAQDGDIYTADPVSGAATAIVTGPELDSNPIWAPDGTRFVFERRERQSGPVELWVAEADGRGLTRISAEPFEGLFEVGGFSSDGRWVVGLGTVDHRHQTIVLAADGTSPPRYFEVGATLDDGGPKFRPGGSEVLFVGLRSSSELRGVYALDPATGDVRTIVAPGDRYDIHYAFWSPDGSRVAYGNFDTTSDELSARTRIVSADGSGDVPVTTPSGVTADAPSAWSNDGRSLIMHLFYGEREVLAVVPVDGRTEPVEISCAPASAGGCDLDWRWSPDDRLLLGSLADEHRAGPHLLRDPATGAPVTTPWSGSGLPSWQRVAP